MSAGVGRVASEYALVALVGPTLNSRAGYGGQKLQLLVVFFPVEMSPSPAGTKMNGRKKKLSK